MLFQAMNNKWLGATRVALGCLLFVAELRCEAQNLVPNPSFELLEDSCPQGCCFNPGMRPLHWYTWQNSSDYFNACAQPSWPDSIVDVPRNGFTFQYAYDGDAYCGLFTYWPSTPYREYIGAELLSPLAIGNTYQVSMRVNTALGGGYVDLTGACNNLGLLFTMESNAWLGITGPEFGYRNYAHVYSPTVITDTAGWTLISGSFTADSAYRYVVLGNFFTDSLTDTQLLVPGATYLLAYHLIDAVCVSASTEGCEQVGIAEGAGQGAFHARPDAASSTVTLSWTEHQRFSYEVEDVAGRHLLSGTAMDGSGSIAVAGWVSGIYLVTASCGKERISSRFAIER